MKCAIPIGTRVTLLRKSYGAGEPGLSGTVIEPRPGAHYTAETDIYIKYDGAEGGLWAHIRDLNVIELPIEDPREYLKAVTE